MRPNLWLVASILLISDISCAQLTTRPSEQTTSVQTQSVQPIEKSEPDLAYWLRTMEALGSDTVAQTPLNEALHSVAVVVEPEVVEGWYFLYRFITETEFVLCLEGVRKKGILHITGFRLSRMEKTSVNSVRYAPCESPLYVGTAHNHPPIENSNESLCYQSEPDKRSFGMDQRAIVDIVLCGNGKYRWWLKDGRTQAVITTSIQASQQ